MNKIFYQDELITRLELNGSEKFISIDTKNYNRIKMFTWYENKVKRSQTSYARASLPGTRSSLYLHRLIMSFPDKDIDHLNRDGLNNTLENLRLSSRSNNMMNRLCKTKKSNLPKGVIFRNDGRSKPFIAQCNFGEQKHLGSFKTADQAARAYDQAALKYDKQFALTNFPREEYL